MVHIALPLELGSQPAALQLRYLQTLKRTFSFTLSRSSVASVHEESKNALR